MKKVICLFAVLAMVMALAACGNSGSSEGSKDVETQKAAFDFDNVVSTLKNSDAFKVAKEQIAEDIEIEYDVTLEDVENFAMYKDSDNFNLFIVAKAKDGYEKLMYDELQKVVDTYSDAITDSVYPEVQQYSPKVDSKVVIKDDGVYICIIADDAEDLSAQIEK